MNKTITRKIGIFKAVTESGKIVMIVAHQDFHIAEEFGQESQEIPGTIRLTSSTGRPVNKIDENTYEILGETEKIRVTKV